MKHDIFTELVVANDCGILDNYLDEQASLGNTGVFDVINAILENSDEMQDDESFKKLYEALSGELSDDEVLNEAGNPLPKKKASEIMADTKEKIKTAKADYKTNRKSHTWVKAFKETNQKRKEELKNAKEEKKMYKQNRKEFIKLSKENYKAMRKAAKGNDKYKAINGAYSARDAAKKAALKFDTEKKQDKKDIETRIRDNKHVLGSKNIKDTKSQFHDWKDNDTKEKADKISKATSDAETELKNASVAESLGISDYTLFNILEANGYVPSDENLGKLKFNLVLGYTNLLDSNNIELTEGSSEDYYLYRVLENNHFKTHADNLRILKEGLESGKYLLY